MEKGTKFYEPTVTVAAKKLLINTSDSAQYLQAVDKTVSDLISDLDDRIEKKIKEVKSTKIG